MGSPVTGKDGRASVPQLAAQPGRPRGQAQRALGGSHDAGYHARYDRSAAAAGGSRGLAGRERECTAIDGLLEDACAGTGGALMVRGEPGIGKTALLGYARRRAAPLMVVLSAGGVQAESDLAFAGLHELLRPVLDYLGELPDTQSQALAGALGLAPSMPADRLLISAAVLSLLAAAADHSPILCLVDDAQWVDRPSADALVFTARRLRAEPMAILFGVRDGEARLFEAAGLPELTLTGLSQQSAESVLAASGARAGAERA